MDTLTHALSGALLARATAPDPAQARITTGARMVAGALAAAFPDTDFFLGFFRWFAEYPALYRIDRGNPSTCVWFEDLRFVTAGRDANIFRYGVCREAGAAEGRVFRLRDDGSHEPAGR